MVDNPLELGGSLYRLLRRQIRQAANVDRIELAEGTALKPMPPVARS